MTGPSVSYAIVHDDPPSVHIAEDIDVLHRALALDLVGRTKAERFGSDREDVRTALLEERWGDAVVAWIQHTDIAIDVYTDRVLTADDLPAELIGAQLQFSALFRD